MFSLSFMYFQNEVDGFVFKVSLEEDRVLCDLNMDRNNRVGVTTIPLKLTVYLL